MEQKYFENSTLLKLAQHPLSLKRRKTDIEDRVIVIMAVLAPREEDGRRSLQTTENKRCFRYLNNSCYMYNT